MLRKKSLVTLLHKTLDFVTHPENRNSGKILQKLQPFAGCRFGQHVDLALANEVIRVGGHDSSGGQHVENVLRGGFIGADVEVVLLLAKKPSKKITQAFN